MSANSNSLATYLSFFTSVEVGLASRLISASLFKYTLLATALITDSTVLGFIKLGVPATISMCNRCQEQTMGNIPPPKYIDVTVLI